jgi:ABC-type phosphate/phosphonate transport system ATPase subunit
LAKQRRCAKRVNNYKEVLQTLEEKEKILSKEDFKIYQKVKLDPLNSISESAKMMMICDPIGQSGFGKVCIASFIDDISNERKVIVKVLFQGKENEQKNEAEKREIIRKIYHDVDKVKLMSHIYYFRNVLSLQMQDKCILIQLFIS